MGIAVFPVLVGLMMIAESFVVVLFSERWIPMVPVLRVVCLIGILNAASTIVPWLLVARHKQTKVFRYDLMCALVIPFAIVSGVKWGILGVAWAHVIALGVVLIYLYRQLFKDIQLSALQYVVALAPGGGSALVMALAVGVFQYVGDYFGQTVGVKLLGGILVGAFSYIGSLYLLSKDSWEEALGFVKTILRKR